MPGTWSYNPTDLSTTPKDQVRLEIGDTDSQSWLLSDEEITYALTQERNFWAGAARCAEMAGRAILRRADVKLGRSLQITYTKAAEQYFNMARMLRAKAMGTTPPYVGGVLAADKSAIENNEGLVAPAFTRTMMENPWVGGYTTDSLADVTNAPAVDESDASVL